MENKYFMKSILTLIQVQCAYLNVFIFQVCPQRRHRDETVKIDEVPEHVKRKLFENGVLASQDENSKDTESDAGFFPEDFKQGMLL